jgi:glycine/D-amino acid oxidase-like deaminating enzyme
MQRLGDASSTAQVNPRKLTEAFMARAEALAGSSFVQGTIEGILTAEQPAGAAAVEAAAAGSAEWSGVGAAAVAERAATGGAAARRVTGVRIDGIRHAADTVVVAMGPWSNVAAAWLPVPQAVSSQKYHSAVLEPGVEVRTAARVWARRSCATRMGRMHAVQAGVDATALFTTVRRQAGGPHADPEVYPRPDGTVYVCGEPEAPALPPSASDVHVHEDAVERIIGNCAIAAPALASAHVAARQACFLPLTPDGLPMLGAVAGVGGAFVATGHSCWGILNAPATGLAMAELIADGAAACVDLGPYDPGRFED